MEMQTLTLMEMQTLTNVKDSKLSRDKNLRFVAELLLNFGQTFD